MEHTRQVDKKWNNTNFKNFLCTYDLVCLSECWLEKDYSLEVPEFTSYVFPRKSKSIQGGGTIVLIRDSLTQYISAIKEIV